MDKSKVGFVVAGGIMTILFLLVVNLLTSTLFIWFIYPAFGILLLIMNIVFINNRQYKLQAVLASAFLIGFLVTVNMVHSPSYPWFIYAVFPIIWWPISAFIGRKAGTVTFALVASTSIVLYYVILNNVMGHSYPWAIYPAFAILWWPLTLYYVRKKEYFRFSVVAATFVILFFTTVNVVSTPHTIWAVYPMFAVLWWPLSMYYFYVKKHDRTPVEE
ncbi:hypothetical protein [Bacillus horti]|uniref:DUF5668 domain-containing protein n=1 Tax=Caldalkalibacillus horti TaxID=77523 RepID=A0ABT9W4D8_9BACI|nr:hypothetical protein [Bacillus horti]MDQ0167957.1 hypothetical protein [Bacillus horti]